MKTHFPNLAGAASLLLLFSACGQKPIVYTTLDSYPVYTGNDLRTEPIPWGESKFRLWSPGADAAEVRLYVSATDDTLAAETFHAALRFGQYGRHSPRRQKRDVLHFPHPSQRQLDGRTPGIWGQSHISTQRERAAIVNLSETNPDGWNTDQPASEGFADMASTSCNVRDISINPNSGIAHVGNSCLAEENTHSPDGLTTGLTTCANWASPHVHLLPVFDLYPSTNPYQKTTSTTGATTRRTTTYPKGAIPPTRRPRHPNRDLNRW